MYKENETEIHHSVQTNQLIVASQAMINCKHKHVFQGIYIDLQLEIT